jgi:site-specific DNA recombinase
MIRAAAYTRVTTEAQAAEDGVSLEDQLADIEAYSKAKGYQLVAHYQDVVSGDSKHRPEFKHLLRHIPANKFDVVVAWKSDRLTRTTSSATALVEAMEGTDVTLEAVKDTIDKDTIELYAWVGKRELKAIRDRVRMGHRGKVKRGTLMGVAKYGYTLEGPKEQIKPVINETEAAVVRRIFQEYLQGNGLIQLANHLRRDNIPTRKGGDWTPAFIWTIITNPAYTGKGQYGRRSYYKKDNGEKDIRKVKWTDGDTWVTVEYPPIIDKETFKKAQEIRKLWLKPMAKGSHGTDKFILKGRLWCEHCGRRYTTDMAYHYQKFVTATGEVKRYKSKNELRRYVCTSHKHRGTDCPRPTIYAQSLENEVWEKLRQFQKHPAPMRAEIEQQYQAIKTSGILPALEVARKHLQDIQERERRAHIPFANGMREDDYKLLLKQIREGREFWEQKAGQAEKEAGDLPNALDLLDNFEKHLATMQYNLDNADNELKAATVALWVDSVTVGKDELDVIIRYAQQRIHFTPHTW